MKFKDFSRTFSSKFKDLLYKKGFVIQYINSAICFARLAYWKKSSLRFGFHTLLHQRYSVRLRLTAHFEYYLQLKVKNFAHSRIFKDCNPNSRTFQGLEFSFANSRTFQGFQGPWQPCQALYQLTNVATHSLSKFNALYGNFIEGKQESEMRP